MFIFRGECWILSLFFVNVQGQILGMIIFVSIIPYSPFLPTKYQVIDATRPRTAWSNCARNHLKSWQIQVKAISSPQIHNLHENQIYRIYQISLDRLTVQVLTAQVLLLMLGTCGGSMDPWSVCLRNTQQIGVKAVLNYTQQKARTEYSKKGKLRSEQIKYMHI